MRPLQIQIQFTTTLTVEIDPAGLAAYKADPSKAAGMIATVRHPAGKWIDTMPNRALLLADPAALKAVCEACGDVPVARPEAVIAATPVVADLPVEEFGGGGAPKRK